MGSPRLYAAAVSELHEANLAALWLWGEFEMSVSQVCGMLAKWRIVKAVVYMAPGRLQMSVETRQLSDARWPPAGSSLAGTGPPCLITDSTA
jgi:hypothetical protein